MGSFNPFDFLKGRMASSDLTEEEINNFEPYMVQTAISMVHGYESIIDNMNTKQFYALPKQVQAMAFTSFDGHKLLGKWKIAKRTEVENTQLIIEKIMKVLECTHNDAVAYMAQRLIDVDEIEDMYMRLFEPDKYLEKKNAKSRKKSK